MTAHRQLPDCSIRKKSFAVAPLVIVCFVFSYQTSVVLTAVVYLHFLHYMTCVGIGGLGEKQIQTKNKGVNCSVEAEEASSDNTSTRGAPVQKHSRNKRPENFSCKTVAKLTTLKMTETVVERSEMKGKQVPSSVVDESMADILLGTSASHVDAQDTCLGTQTCYGGNKNACLEPDVGQTGMSCLKIRLQKEQQRQRCSELDHDSVEFTEGDPLKSQEIESSPCFEEMLGVHGQPACGMEQELIAEDTGNEEEARVIEDYKPEDRGAEMIEEQHQLHLEQTAEPHVVGDNGQDEDDEDDNKEEDRKGKEVEEGKEDDRDDEDDEDDDDDNEDIENTEVHHEKDTDDEEDNCADEDIEDKDKDEKFVQWSEVASIRVEEVENTQPYLKFQVHWVATVHYQKDFTDIIITKVCIQDCTVSRVRLGSGLLPFRNQTRSNRGEPVLNAELTGNTHGVNRLDCPPAWNFSPDKRETSESGVTVLELPSVTVNRRLCETRTIPSCISSVTLHELHELCAFDKTDSSEFCGTSRHQYNLLTGLEDICLRVCVSSDLTEFKCSEMVSVTPVMPSQTTPDQHPALPTYRPKWKQVSVGVSGVHKTAGKPCRTGNTEVVVCEERVNQSPSQPEDVREEDQIIGRREDDEVKYPHGLSSDPASDSLSQSQTHTSSSGFVITNDMLSGTEGYRNHVESSSAVYRVSLLSQCTEFSRTSDTNSVNVPKLGCACHTVESGIRTACKIFEAEDTVSTDDSAVVALIADVFPEKGEYDADSKDDDDDDNDDGDDDKLLMKNRLEMGTSSFQEQTHSKFRLKEKESKEGGASCPCPTAVSAEKLQCQEVMPFRDLRTKAAEHQESVVAEKGSPSTKKSPKDCNGLDDFGELRPLRPDPGFIHWTVAMVRSPYRQQVQNIQQNSSATAGLENEWNRLSTFSQYEAPDGIFVIPIAGAGFFLVSDVRRSNAGEAKVECAFCRLVVVIRRFLGRNAMSLHAEFSPQCRFVRGENVGNISIAETAERFGAAYLNKYSVSSGRAVDDVATQRRPEYSPSLPLTEVLATDSEPNAAEEHAGNSPSLPANKPGSFALPAVSGSTYPAGCSQSSRARDAVSPQQGAGSGDFGETVADSRPASQAGHGMSLQAAATSGETAMPYQTATVTPPQPQPQPQPSNTGTDQSSQSSTGNQPATSQTSGPHQTARVEAGPMTTLGTARAGAPANTTQGGSEGEARNQTGGEGDGTENSTERQLVTYEELGIFSQRPKRPDMALVSVRVNTFEGWPHNTSHPKEQMAEAGFYYTGHADLVRCFHCKGGLKTWESSDQPWIEHSRWFPRCPFLKLCKGQKFVQAVQKLNDSETKPMITENDVIREIRRMEEEERRNLASDVVLLETLPDRNTSADPEGEVLARAGLRIDADVTEASMREVAERLADENEELASTTLCKMCQTNEVNVLFLPCGHLVSCAQCAPALRTCAMCRQPVRGSVRVLLDEKRESEEMLPQNQSDGAAAS